MKKTYLSAVALSLISLSVSAQGVSGIYNFAPLKKGKELTKRSVTSNPSTNNNFQTKALNILWTDDFSGGTNPLESGQGQWTAAGLNAGYWAMGDFTHPFPLTGPEAMTTDYLKWDSYNPNSAEGGGFATTQVNGVIESPSISYNATNSIGIKFNTEALYCCNGSMTPFGVSVSTDDGSTWSDTLYFDFGIGRNEETEAISNPLEVTQNLGVISPVGDQATFKFKFVWDGNDADPNGQYNTHYYWLIDDVSIYEIPGADLVAQPYFWGVEGAISYNTYFQTPTLQVAPIEFNAIAINDGGAALTEVTLDVDVASGTFTGSSPAGLTIASGTQDTATVSTMFTPPATLMSYPTTWALTQTEIDEVPGNNSLPGFTFEVTENTYAADNGVASGNMFNGGDAYKVGAWFDIFNNQDLYGIDVNLNSATVNGAIVRGILYEVNIVSNAIDYNQVATSNYHDIVAADKVGFLSLQLTTPYQLVAGQTYMVAVETDGDGGISDDVVVNSAQLTESFIGFQDETGTWYTGFIGGTNAPMVRMNFDQTLSLNENESVSSFSVYPNPATDNISVNYELANVTDVTINVTDVAGKVVAKSSTESQATGANTTTFNTNAFNAGIYFVNITTEAGVITQKFIKK